MNIRVILLVINNIYYNAQAYHIVIKLYILKMVYDVMNVSAEFLLPKPVGFLFIFRFGLGSFPMRMIISGTTAHFSSKDELQEVCDFMLVTI